MLHCKVEPDFCLAIETSASQFSKLTTGKHLTENGDSPCTKSTVHAFLSSLFYCCSLPSFYVGILLRSLWHNLGLGTWHTTPWKGSQRPANETSQVGAGFKPVLMEHIIQEGQSQVWDQKKAMEKEHRRQKKKQESSQTSAAQAFGSPSAVGTALRASDSREL